MTNYITTGGNVYIAAHNDDNLTKHIKGPDGTTIALVIPKKWNEYDEDYVQQDGIVVAVPAHCTEENGEGEKRPAEVQIQPGDRIFTHHHLCHEDNGTLINLDGIAVWKLTYEQCYCVVSQEGEVIKVLGRWVLLEPIPEKWETETGVLKTYRVDQKTHYAKVAYMSDRSREELNMVEGDTVFIHNRATYKLKINGKLFYRARIEDIYAVVNEEEVEYAA